MKKTNTAEGKRSSRSIPVEAVDNDGRIHRRTLKATIISFPKAMSGQATAEDLADLSMPQSAAEEEEQFAAIYSGDRILDPPYPLMTLTSLVENSTELGQCIRAMVTNTVGFGFKLRERPLPANVDHTAVTEEKELLDGFFGAAHVKYSAPMLMKRVVADLHACGNGYLELIEDSRRDLVGLNHVHGHSGRLTKQDTSATLTHVPRVRRGMIEWVPRAHRFRRYVQVRNQALTWFREAGDPRRMDKRTGRYLAANENLAPRYLATSLVHFSRYSPFSPYGVPDWIGNLFSIFGSRAAELTNYRTISQNNIPAMFVMVENGTLTKASVSRLRKFAEQQIQGSSNYSKFIILEGEPMDEGMPDPTKLSIKVQPLRHLQTHDELFQQYDANNKEKIRQAFRLPPIFVGHSKEYNRATADTATALADEQVFAPDRTDFNYLMTRFVLLPLGARYHTFYFNHPNITNDQELVRMMVAAERSGAMTPKRADRVVRDVFGDDIGPLPTGIDLNTPYSLQFALAQKGVSGEPGQQPTMFEGGRPSDTPGIVNEAAAEKVVAQLVYLRQKLDQELESRLLPAEWEAIDAAA